MKVRFSTSCFIRLVARLSCWVVLFLFPSTHLQAQSSGNSQADSLKQALKAKKTADSLNRIANQLKMKAFRDSMQQVREARKLAQLAREKQLKEKKKQREIQSRQLAKMRKQKADSLQQVRNKKTDSLQSVRNQKEKARKALTKYKDSKKYKDSIRQRQLAKQDSLSAIRQARLLQQKAKNQLQRDSMLSVRTRYNDSVKAVRTRINDSTKAAVKARVEEQKAIRQKLLDSIATVRKQRTDSLAAVRKAREEKTAVSEKKKDEKQKALALKLLHDKKQKEWTNDKLLKRKWTMVRRIYQNTVTRYNYFYNARRKYLFAIETLTKNHKDDFSKRISLYPYDVRKAGTSVAGDMDSIIKKSSFSTQIHDPRSKWFDDLYFLMGRASYLKNDFDGAITTFQFVANEYKDLGKKKNNKTGTGNKSGSGNESQSIATPESRKGIKALRHHPVRNKALIWLAKSYIEAEQYSESMALISTLEKDKVFPKRHKADLLLTRAHLELTQQNVPEAILTLTEVLKQKHLHGQRPRIEFVLGQLYAEQADYVRSSAHFKKSISGKSNPEMDFYTKLFIAQNAARGGGDKAFAIQQLERILRDGKYEKYRSETYNVLAGIYAEDDPDKAIAALHKSLRVSDRQAPLQLATTFATLGRIYYNQGEYELAKESYDSASFHGTNPPLDNLAEVNTRKDVLTDVVKNLRIIRKQDSLLALSKLSEKEQKAIARKEAERQKKALAVKEGEEKSTVVALSAGNNIKSNWYFYNNSFLERGATEFRQKWGTRKLEDNWRRRTALSNMVAESEGDEEDAGSKEDGGSVSIEGLLAEIPNTPAQKDKAHDAIMHAYYDLGLIYYAQLQDYRNSIRSLDSLLTRYSKTDLRKQAYYTEFLDYQMLKDEIRAKRFKDFLLKEFGESEFARLAADPDYMKVLKDQVKQVDRYYDTTYQAYLDTQYNFALQRVAYAKTAFQGKTMMAKFELLGAVCEAGLKNFEACKTGLEEVIKNYPSTPEQARAQELLNYLNSSGVLQGDTTKGGVVQSENKPKDPEPGKELKEAAGKAVYAFDAKQEHLFMIYVNKIDGRALGLKAGLSDFNLFKHESEELKTGQNLFTVGQGVLTVSKFSNAIFAKIYMNEVAKEPDMFKQFQEEEYTLCLISVPNFNELIRTRDILGYLDFYTKNYK